MHPHHPGSQQLFQQPHPRRLRGASSCAFPGISDKTVVPPSLLAQWMFDPKCGTFPSVRIALYLLTPTLRSPGDRPCPCPSASVFCGAGCLVFVVLLPSERRGLGRERSPGAHPCTPPSRRSVTAALCPRPSVCPPVVGWCLPVLSFLCPLPISLLVMVPLLSLPSHSSSSYPPDSLAPPHLPVLPSFPLHLLFYVYGQGHRHTEFFSSASKGVLSPPRATVRVIPWWLGHPVLPLLQTALKPRTRWLEFACLGKSSH